MKKNALKFVEVIVLLGKTTLPNLYLVGKNMLIPQEKTNRNYKDSVFVDLFTLGISDRKYRKRM